MSTTSNTPRLNTSTYISFSIPEGKVYTVHIHQTDPVHVTHAATRQTFNVLPVLEVLCDGLRLNLPIIGMGYAPKHNLVLFIQEKGPPLLLRLKSIDGELNTFATRPHRCAAA